MTRPSPMRGVAAVVAERPGPNLPWPQSPPETDGLAPARIAPFDPLPSGRPRTVPRELRNVAGVVEVWQRAAALRPQTGALVAIGSADGGVGRSTLTAALGGLLAAASVGKVLAVDATGQAWGGLEHRAAAGEHSVRDAIDHSPDWAPGADLEPLARPAPDGLWVLAAECGLGGNKPAGLYELGPVISRAREHYALTLLDLAGGDLPETRSAMWVSNVTVLVARPTQDSVQHTLRLLGRLSSSNLAPAVARTVVVLVSTAPAASKNARAAARQLRAVVSDVVHVPFDSQLARVAPVALGQLRRTTRAALVGAAGAVLAHCPADADRPIWEPPEVRS
ncbi:hypothetical protein AB0M43_37690 [Longispora sp. NPDC051575]|uniref:hypothetical protein n=1 Tax=Longispora sp. NPDC051575 TaxID=3154943 RepID=UPI00343ABC73